MSANDGWGDDWEPTPKAATTQANSADDWGDDTNTKTYDNSSYGSDQSKGLGRGLGRAKRMEEWRQRSTQQSDRNGSQWADTESSSNWDDSRNGSHSSGRDYSSRPERENNRSFGSDNRFGNSLKRKIQISSSFVGRVIGRGGQTIKELQSKSGARININKDSGNSYDTDIELSGTNEQIDCAQKLINELIGGNHSNQSFANTNSYNSNRSEANPTSTESTGKSAEPEPEYIDWGAAIKESEEATKKKWASLPPIAKQFYFESPVVRAMNADEVDRVRANNNNLVVSHFNEGDTRVIPNPVLQFQQAFEHFPEILEEIREQGLETPSPIQCQSWPILLSGYDLIGIAQTGSGKTLAYLLPAMIHIDSQPTSRTERAGPTALIIVPTTEVAEEIENECQKYRYRDKVHLHI